MRIAIKFTAVLLSLGPLICGCRTTRGVADRAGSAPYRARPVVLAAHVELARQPLPSRQEAQRQEGKDEEKPAGPGRQPSAGNQAEQQPPESEADRESIDKEPRPRSLPYTTPSAVALLALGAFSNSGDEPDDSDHEGDGDQVDFVGGGRESAESTMGIAPSPSSANLVGRPGLTRASVGADLVGRPGLQEGPARLLGFATMENIFTPQMNLLSGPTGRCRDLSMAGFFGGSRAGCEAHFVRR